MTAANLVGLLVLELDRMIAPLRRAITSEVQRSAMLLRLGWDPDALPPEVVRGLTARVGLLGEALDGLRKWISKPPETIGDMQEAVRQIQELVNLLQGLTPPSVANFPEIARLGEDLASLLTTDYFQQQHPVLAQVFALLGVFQVVIATDDQLIVASDDPAPSAAEGRPVRLPTARLCFKPERIAALLSSPVETLRAEYPIAAATTPEQATAEVARLLERVGNLLHALGVGAQTSAKSSYGVDFGEAGNSLARRSLQFSYPFTVWSTGAKAVIGATVVVSPSTLEDLGVAVFPFGQASFHQALGGWAVDVSVNGVVPAFRVQDGAIEPLDAVAAGGAFRADFRALPAEGETAVWAMGSTAGLSISVEDARVAVECSVGGSEPHYGIALTLENCLIEVGGMSRDGFLSKVFPSGGVRALIGLRAGWANDRGLYLAGSGTFDVTIPVHRTLGPFTLEAFWIGLAVEASAITLLGAVTGGAAIGPIAVSVERVGVTAVLPLGSSASNRVAVEFLPPTGAGLAVDASGITGGGVLSFYPSEGRYDGMLQLRFGDIGLCAIGLISTKLPDGKKGFALLISIGVTFSPPIQLSFGFVLSAVGGLLAVNRRMDVDVLRRGLRNGTLDSILFPEDPVRDAPIILSNLRAAFPTDEGRFVIGPMLTIGWGSPTLITADIGIFIEIPSPIVIALLGQIAATFPRKDDAVVELHIDVLGELNPAKKKLTIDARLHHSKLLAYPLSGDAALRWRWGDKPLFLLSLGGFHPKFRDKPSDVDLRRLRLSLRSTGSFDLRCEVYQALTSNTLQFGTRLELYAEVSKASVHGDLSFDALIEFSPFSFDVTIRGSVTAEAFGKSVSVRLRVDLSGPTPWRARGRASFELCGMDVDVDFHKTWGRDEKAKLPKRDPLPLLLAALKRVESWGSPLPPNSVMVEALRTVKPSAANGGDAAVDTTPAVAPIVLAHPLGTLEVRQKVAPLNVKLERFGNAPLKGHNKFRLYAPPSESPSALELKPVDEYFARAQFEDLSDTQKLKKPSFEKMQGGVSLGSDQLGASGTAVRHDLEYESILLGEDGTSQRRQRAKLPWERGRGVVRGGAAHRGGYRATGLRRFERPAVQSRLDVDEESYVVVRKSTLEPVIVHPTGRTDRGMTQVEAEQSLDRYVRSHPADVGRLEVVPAYEMV